MVDSKTEVEAKKPARRSSSSNGRGPVGQMWRSYEAASRAKRLSSWLAGGGSANAEIATGGPLLRNRARDLVRNNAWARRALGAIVDNTVGHGITAQVGAGEDGAKKFEAWWAEWAGTTACDADGQHDLAGLQRLFLRTVAQSGDCIVRARVRKEADGFPIPLQLQLLEPDHLDEYSTPVQKGAQRQIGGIHFDGIGRRVAYQLFKEHPGETTSTSLASVRVPAEYVAHGYLQERPGQVRGVSWLAAAMIRLRNLDGYEDAELMRQRMATCFAAFVRDPNGDLDGRDSDDEDGEAPFDFLEPGTITTLEPGYEIDFANPPKVDGYDQFVSAQLRAVAMSLGITYQMLAGDYSQVNFSSGRMGHLEAQRTIAVWQRDVVINQFLVPVLRWATEAAMIAGLQAAPVRVQWVPPRREMIDPTKEIPALVEAIRAGLTTLPNAIQSLGGDPEQQLQRIKETNDLLDELGLKLTSDPRHFQKKGK